VRFFCLPLSPRSMSVDRTEKASPRPTKERQDKNQRYQNSRRRLCCCLFRVNYSISCLVSLVVYARISYAFPRVVFLTVSKLQASVCRVPTGRLRERESSERVDRVAPVEDSPWLTHFREIYLGIISNPNLSMSDGTGIMLLTSVTGKEPPVELMIGSMLLNSYLTPSGNRCVRLSWAISGRAHQPLAFSTPWVSVRGKSAGPWSC